MLYRCTIPGFNLEIGLVAQLDNKNADILHEATEANQVNF